MKTTDLKKLALTGLTTGAVLLQTVQAQDKTPDSWQISSLLAANTSKSSSPDPNEGNLGYHLMTEEELLLELNADGQRMYNEMDAANKKLAREVASQRCGNANECKGLNACKTDKNDCAGKGSCKGQGKCSLADKNLAVRLVYNKMMEKRAAASGNAKNN